MRGHWTAPGASLTRPASLRSEGGEWVVGVDPDPLEDAPHGADVEAGHSQAARAGDAGNEARAAADDVRVSSRLASIPRRLEFPGGGCFSTLDNDAVDQLLGRRGESGEASLVDRLERRWAWALVAVAALPVCLWLLFTVGLPIVAHPLANAIPERAVDTLDDAVLTLLEEQLLEPTELSLDQMLQAEAQVDRLGLNDRVDLVFHGGGDIGANALALPGGTVVFTDELVELLETDDELAAVLAHEAGHVAEKHSLRNLVQSVGAVAVLGWIFGDLSFVTDLALVSVPAVLQQLSYTRRFEREADAYAHRLLEEHGIPAACLSTALSKLVEQARGPVSELPSILQTHPGLEERIAASGDGPACGE